MSALLKGEFPLLLVQLLNVAIAAPMSSIANALMAVVVFMYSRSKFVVNDVNDDNVRFVKGMKARVFGSPGGEPFGVSRMKYTGWDFRMNRLKG
jgi:hypothetical protein